MVKCRWWSSRVSGHSLKKRKKKLTVTDPKYLFKVRLLPTTYAVPTTLRSHFWCWLIIARRNTRTRSIVRGTQSGVPGVISMECAGRFSSKKGGRVSSRVHIHGQTRPLSPSHAFSLRSPYVSVFIDFLPSWKILMSLLLSLSQNVAVFSSFPFLARSSGTALFLSLVRFSRFLLGIFKQPFFASSSNLLFFDVSLLLFLGYLLLLLLLLPDFLRMKRGRS